MLVVTKHKPKLKNVEKNFSGSRLRVKAKGLHFGALTSAVCKIQRDIDI